jgi:hypothetical protein
VHDKPVMEQDWREVPRSVMFSRVIIAVDCARGEAIAEGGEDARFARYVENELFPFLEEMKAIAELHEMLQEVEGQ